MSIQYSQFDPSNLSRVRDSLSALLQRSNQDAFVIFEEKKTGKFVQFAGSRNEDLLLDLPNQALTELEASKAKVVLRDWGASDPQEYVVFTDEDMDTVAGRQISFQINFGRNVSQAAQACLAIFERVYDFPADFELLIEEN